MRNSSVLVGVNPSLTSDVGTLWEQEASLVVRLVEPGRSLKNIQWASKLWLCWQSAANWSPR